MSIPLSTLSTRAGVLMYPSEAAQVLAENPPLSTDSVITDEVLATRAGCLMYPSIAAEYISEISDSSSSSSEEAPVTITTGPSTFDADATVEGTYSVVGTVTTISVSIRRVSDDVQEGSSFGTPEEVGDPIAGTYSFVIEELPTGVQLYAFVTVTLVVGQETATSKGVWEFQINT